MDSYGDPDYYNNIFVERCKQGEGRALFFVTLMWPSYESMPFCREVAKKFKYRDLSSKLGY